MIYYCVHNLIEVAVGEDISKELLEVINFQIGYFRINKSDHMSYKITILPYNKFWNGDHREFDTFHLVRGVIQKCYDDPKSRLAVISGENQYNIYADSPNFLINLYIELLLLKEGITLVHAAAVANNEGKTILLPGAGGVGKTIILGDLVKNHGYKLLGDDIVGINQYGECYSFPRSFVLKEYHREIYPEVFHRLNIPVSRSPSKKERFSLKKIILDNAPFIGLSKILLKKLGVYTKIASVVVPQKKPYLATVPVDQIFGNDSILDQGTIGEIIFLQRYNGKDFYIESMSEHSLCLRMFSIIHHEWVDSMRQFFTIGALELVDLPKYFNEVTRIIKAGINRQEIKILYIPDQASPKELSEFFYSLITDDI